MLEQILSHSNLNNAWKHVRANKGAAGIDDVTIKEFPAYIAKHWPDVKQQLFDESYQPAPVKRVEIPKRTGGTRPLGIPILLDRLIQQAIHLVLQPMFDPEFSESSYGFRPYRSAHQAVKQVRANIDAGYQYVVDIDLKKFFDNVNHDILMTRVARKVKDKRVLKLIGRFLRAGAMVGGEFMPTTKGVPQGGPLSPLLANIVLDDFDKELEKRGHCFVRYADDFMIFVKSQRAAFRVLNSVIRYLKVRLKLEINTEKSQIVLSKDCDYLGFVFKNKRITWSDASLQRFKDNIRRLTSRSWGVSMDVRLKKLSRYIRGWMAYYALSKYYRPLPLLDEWIRRRVRMCYIKQWRKCRTKIRNLIKLGAVEREAIMVGLSSKGYWRLARTYGSQSGLTNTYLKEQGLISARELWIAFHYPNG